MASSRSALPGHARTLCALGALGSLAAALARLDVGLPPSVPSSADAVWTTLTLVPPERLVLALGRAAALALTGYLLASTLLGAVASRTGWRWAAAAFRAVTTVTVRRSLGRVIGSGLSLTLTLGAGAAPVLAQDTAGPPSTASAPTMTVIDVEAPPATAPEPPKIIMRLLPDPPPPTTLAADTIPSTDTAPSTPETPVTSTVPPPEPADADLGAPIAAAPESPAAPSSAGPTVGTPTSGAATPPPGPHWVIQPGQHLWHVAGATTSAAYGRPATDAETAAYLDRLIDRNRDQLVVPDDPDLVFPGQVFALPPVAA